MPNDLKNVRRRKGDAQLMATSYVVSLCDECDGIHIDLMDQAGEPFAAAVFPTEQIPELVERLLEFGEYAIGRRRPGH